MDIEQQSSTNQISQDEKQEPILISPSEPSSPKEETPKKKRVTVKKKKGQDIVVSKSKMQLFLEEYERCNGNGTEAAMRVFNTTSRANAAAIAHIYLQRAQGMNRMLLEAKGYGAGKLLDKAIARMNMADTKSTDWILIWDRLMKMGGYADFLTKQGITKSSVSVMSVQKGIIDEYVEGEYVDDEER